MVGQLPALINGSRRNVIAVGNGIRPSPTSSSVVVPTTTTTTATLLTMAIDYNDPGVMEEFNIIQLMEYDEVVGRMHPSKPNKEGSSYHEWCKDAEEKLQ